MKLEKVKFLEIYITFKPYNQKRRLFQQNAVYVTQHLSKLFQEERKQLLPRFKEAKRLSKKIFWMAEDGPKNMRCILISLR